jgi:homoserine kinase type II
MNLPILSDQRDIFSPATALSGVLSLWGLRLKATQPQMTIQGSPERTAFRMVVEDDKGAYYVLEQIARRDLEKKRQISRTLDFFAQQKVPHIQPYLIGSIGEAILEYRKEFWQLSPFVAGVSLDRENYIKEGWRGLVLADFLLALRAKANDVPGFAKKNPFSIKVYIDDLLSTIRQHRPELLAQIGPVREFLDREFMLIHDQLPISFCHGDYHPLNVIWSTDDIRAVIDWEFLGYKPEIYDVSNIVGCVGMEHPSALTGDLVKSFIARLRAVQVFADISWDHFLEFMVALRFAWLSEWLRKNDEEMIALELVYMKLLIDERDFLREEWGLG